MKNLILVCVSLLTITSFASTMPQTKAEFCGRFGERPSDKEIIQDLSSESVNLMAFKNDGGLFNGGVCWWHSRFQRNILYLSIFRPDLAKPKNPREIQNLIYQVRLGESVVVIPGYANLEEFSTENQKLIQAELNSWQLYDGVVLGGWMDGLKGDTKIEANLLSSMMNEVFNYVSVKKKIAYEKLQIKGITSHAWLIAGIVAGPNGYEIGYIDSNSPRMSQNYSFKNGDTSFFIKGYGNFVPYLEFKREEERITDTARIYCNLKPHGLITSKKQIEKDNLLDIQDALSAGHN